MKVYVKPTYSNGVVSFWTASPYTGQFILPYPKGTGATEEEAIERFKTCVKDEELNSKSGEVVEVEI